MKNFLLASAAVTFIFFALWLGLSDFEFGKYDSFNEAIEKGIPYKVDEIIYKEKRDGVTVVMYTTKAGEEFIKLAGKSVVAVAFFTGDESTGWKNVGPHGWTNYQNNNLTLYHEVLRVDKSNEERIHEMPVTYGEINNPEIKKVVTRSIEENSFEDARIIEASGKRYYFQIGWVSVVRGLSEKGTLINQQGG